MQNKPYQVVVTLGELAQPPVDVRVVALTATGAVEAPVVDETGVVSHRFVDELRASELSTSDLRSRVLFVAESSADPAELVSAYALTTFFSGRRVDFQLSDELQFASPVDDRSRAFADDGRPSNPAEVIVCAAVGGPGVDVALDAALSAQDVSALRFARRAKLLVADRPVQALLSFLLVAGVRARNTTERLPLLASSVDDPGIDLDLFRRAAAQLRRSSGDVDLAALADRVPPSAQAALMLEAAKVPATCVMVALGATSPGNGFWHCPRPDRHTNGDANASMRVEVGRVRCFRCDKESVDVVRLVADTKDCSFTEAAEWVLSEVAPRVEELSAQVPENAIFDPAATAA